MSAKGLLVCVCVCVCFHIQTLKSCVEAYGHDGTEALKGFSHSLMKKVHTSFFIYMYRSPLFRVVKVEYMFLKKTWKAMVYNLYPIKVNYIFYSFKFPYSFFRLKTFLSLNNYILGQWSFSLSWSECWDVYILRSILRLPPYLSIITSHRYCLNHRKSQNHGL